jgi:hypothetical protein
MKAIVLAACAVLATTAGCKGGKGDRGAEVVAQHRAEVEKVLDAIVAVGNKPLGPVTGAFTVHGPLNDGLVLLPADPAAIAAYRAGKPVDRNWFDSGGVSPTVPRILAGEKEDPNQIGKMMTGFAALKRVLLVKTLEHNEPAIDGEKFTPGHVAADLYLFGIDGTSYGSVHIDATNSNSVTFEQRKHSNDAKTMVERDLETNATAALDRALGMH